MKAGRETEEKDGLRELSETGGERDKGEDKNTEELSSNLNESEVSEDDVVGDVEKEKLSAPSKGIKPSRL